MPTYAHDSGVRNHVWFIFLIFSSMIMKFYCSNHNSTKYLHFWAWFLGYHGFYSWCH